MHTKIFLVFYLSINSNKKKHNKFTYFYYFCRVNFFVGCTRNQILRFMTSHLITLALLPHYLRVENYDATYFEVFMNSK